MTAVTSQDRARGLFLWSVAVRSSSYLCQNTQFLSLSYSCFQGEKKPHKKSCVCNSAPLYGLTCLIVFMSWHGGGRGGEFSLL